MTSGLRRVSGTGAGTDFDSIFDPYQVGTKPANTGFRHADGTGDIANKYAPIAYGTKAGDVGYRTAAGVDVSNLFAAAGTAVYVANPLALNGQTYTATDYTLSGGSAKLTLTIGSDGTYSIKDQNNVVQGSGVWWSPGATAGIGASYEAKITLTLTAAVPTGATGATTNTAAAFTNLGSGASCSAQCVFSGTGGGEKDLTYSVNVQFRKSGTTTVLSNSTMTWQINAGSTGGA